MLQTYYSYLKSRIQLDEVLAELKVLADWYLRQYYSVRGKDDDGTLVSTPIVYIELMPITWRTLPMNIQRALLTFRLHIVTESVFVDERNFLLQDPSTVTNNSHLIIRERLHKILMNQRVKLSDLPSYQGEIYRINGEDAVIMESIVRIGSPTTTEMMNNLVLSIEEFQCIITDYTASPLYLKVDPPITLEEICIMGDNDFTVEITVDHDNICTQGMATLNGTVTGGAGEIVYQWQILNGSSWDDIPGANSANYLTDVLSGPDGTIFTYRLKVTRLDFTAYSNEQTVSLNDPPEVYINPNPPEITTSDLCIIFSEVVGGVGINNYQWQKRPDGDPVGPWVDIPGANDDNLKVFGSAYLEGVFYFRLHVTQDPGCDAYSAVASVTITP